jgi:predicted nucleic acid-binding protein
MDVRFVPYAELKTYFEKERLEKDLEEKSKMGICSAADLLFHIETTDLLNHRVVKEIRGIIKAYDYMRSHLVVASTFAFLEIARKFVEVSGNRFTIEQFSGFIDQPPEWFWVAPLDESLFLELLRIPPYVTMPGGQLKNIEWADAIHLATALSRENCLLATTDSRLKQLSILG